MPGALLDPWWSPDRTTREQVRAALEGVVLEALLRPPCGVLFSGGRDSSTLLAVAMHVARREGLAPPIACTLRAAEGDAEELGFQELVVDHLRPVEWRRITITDELDLLGPQAQVHLRRHGVLWPSLAHNANSFFPDLAGGSLIDGEGGDEVLGARRSAPLAQLVRRRRPPGPRLARLVGRAVAPTPVRRWLARDIIRDVDGSWLRPDESDRFAAALIADSVAEPLSWPRSVQLMAQRRAVRLAMANLDLVAADHQVARVHPLLDERFLRPLCGYGGRWGFPSRTACLRALVDDLLPDVVLRRLGKAVFNDVAIGPNARAFIEGWDGSGVDDALVDPTVLDRLWRSADIPSGTFLLLQRAWLATQHGAARPTMPSA